MIRPSTIIGAVVLAVSVFALFQVKYQVQNMSKDLAEAQRQIAAEREAIHVLKAEWSYLNQPERLEKLAKNYLQLKPIDVAQVRSVDGNSVEYVLGRKDHMFASKITPTMKPMLASAQ